ncbi:hypothetical protein ACFLTR_04110 [Chloroflexota bacterium]
MQHESLTPNSLLKEEAKNGKQGKKECEKAEAAKGEEGKEEIEGWQILNTNL